MTKSNSSPAIQNPPKSSWFSGCVVTVLVLFLAILGIYNLAFGSIIAYVFSSAQMFSPTIVTILLIIGLTGLIYFFLAFRLKRQHWLISLALLVVVWFILPLPLSFLINASTARVRNDGYSMTETLPGESYILVDKLAYQQNPPQRGDIVVFKHPMDPEQGMIKRVIGLPGETVFIDQGQVSISGVPIAEPYISKKAPYSGKWEIPTGQYFVLGDNRPDSSDSHNWGFVPQENITGKAVWIYFPFNSFRKIPGVNY